MVPPPTGLRRRLLAGERLLGTFVKTPSPAIVEIVALAGFDFVVLDAEHAPLDRVALDLLLLASHAARLPAIVRTADASAAQIVGALDGGAAGVLVPHVGSAEVARRVVAAARYGAGRGFSNSPRAGGYGQTPLWEHVDAADAATIVMAMIEDAEGVAAVEAILAVDGVDAMFVGRADLAVALDDRTAGAQRVAAIARRIIDTARAAGKPAALFVGSVPEATELRAQGAAVFVLSSEQAILRHAATSLVEDWHRRSAAE